ncbi:MAG: hypothetical protein QOA17_06660, partial [Nitrososphaeraceae archaeon]|nr:hypothetical protein [Nitrososphaeraceae archaeon]
MTNENLSKNSVDERISTLENSDKVKERNDTVSQNQIQRTNKVDEDIFKDIILKFIPKESQI